MSTQRKPTGGLAFPVVGPGGLDSYGMTLRDYFAAAALPSVISLWESAYIRDGEVGIPLTDHDEKEGIPSYSPTTEATLIAIDAYAVADAMLEARK